MDTETAVPLRSQSIEHFSIDCTNRLLLDEIADKWSILVMAVLCEKPLRFNELKRRLHGITQKVLTQTLRRLERNGLVERHVLPTSPVAVEYEITSLGHTIKQPLWSFYQWTVDNWPQVEAARQRFEARQAELASGGGV